MRCFRGMLVVAALLTSLTTIGQAKSPNAPRIAIFRCDITPPIGQPLFSTDALRTIEQPLLAKGIIVESQTKRYVLCALDWCELCSGSYDALRAKIAQAAGTTPAQVAVQCVHLHTAPIVDFDAYALLTREGIKPVKMHMAPEVFDAFQQRLALAIKKSLDDFRAFDRVGTGQAKVDRVASNRRCRDATGKIRPRFSSTAKTPALRDLPEGLVDPFLKTITFAHGEKPLVRLHYYATHPQTRYNDGRASSDMVGDAREKLEHDEGVFQVYFTGCGGDITVGKYNDGSDQCRRDLARRLLDGMKASIAVSKFVPAEPIRWRLYPLVLPRRTDAGFSREECLARLRDAKAQPLARFFGGGVRLASLQRAELPFQLTSLEIGHIRVLHLPGEPMVCFQLFAQSLRPADFVAVVGYGDGAPGYICSERAFAEGGYEPTASNVKPQSEKLLKKAIAELLDVAPPAELQ